MHWNALERHLRRCGKIVIARYEGPVAPNRLPVAPNGWPGALFPFLSIVFPFLSGVGVFSFKGG